MVATSLNSKDPFSVLGYETAGPTCRWESDADMHDGL